ncbi:hypothetical protein [Sphingomonas humi]|uniref:SGNH/GDSL hydrolase family protein n=1 Tax=Sphingomonas humi TaxID=335630 RepID=A0ABP7RGW9_9SPHN
MPSSTSPSDAPLPPVGTIREGALPRGLRLTASDRPGQAQPVPVRDVPARPWKGIALVALLVMLIGVGGWEAWARGFGLRTADIGDSPQKWAETRASIAPDDLVIVGDSRILFDTDLAHFQRLTGVAPKQLAIHGTNGRNLLENIAADPAYKGLLLVGMADTSYFRPVKAGAGVGAPWIDGYARNREPSQISGLYLDRWLQQLFAFLDEDMRLSRLLSRNDHGWRKGSDSPYDDVWKVDESFPGRQRFMWGEIEKPGYLQDQARHAWGGFKGPPGRPADIAETIARSRDAVNRIRARGGDVIFIRPPSAPQLRVNEEQRMPKAKVWDRLLAQVPARGIHADDLPAAQGLDIPEWSHLSRTCATVFTDAYVRRLVQLTDRVALRPDAPPPLATANCKGQLAGAPLRRS